MIRMENADDLPNFFMLRLFSILRMNAFSLVKNRNKSIMSLESAYSIEAPLVMSEYIPNETALDACKSIELDMAYKLKGVIENTVFDSAIDASLVNVLGYLPIRKTQANDIAVSIPDIVANGGEKMAVSEALRAAVHVEIMQIAEGKDETVIQNARGHKTYLNVEVPYITDNGEIKTTKNTIGIHVTPRRVKNIDIKTIFRDLDPEKVMKSYVKTTKGEEKFIKDFLLDIKNIESIAKMNADGGNLLAYVRKENLRSKFNSYVYPFLFFMLDEVVCQELQAELKINLDSMNEREKYRKQLMALGILTYDSGTDIIDIYYDGDTSIQSITMDDFVLSASKYEKEIQQMIRLNQNR